MTPRIPSLTEIRERYIDRARSLPAALEKALREDPRPGARALLASVDRRRHDNRSEGQRLRHLLKYEQEWWARGVTLIAGIDEAGMSPLAGPVVAGAVILRVEERITGVDDSKKLDADRREELAAVIKARAIAWGVGVVESELIDRINIYHAGMLAMRRAVDSLATKPDCLLIDARRLRSIVGIPQQAIVGGDGKSASIAAASIIAKTTRDALMLQMDVEYPGYGFARHKGYPVREHLAAIQRLGVVPIHRRSFGPVRVALGLPPLHPEQVDAADANGESTRVEAAAACNEGLEGLGDCADEMLVTASAEAPMPEE